jgi:hypothetical protein
MESIDLPPKSRFFCDFRFDGGNCLGKKIGSRDDFDGSGAFGAIPNRP